MKRRVLSLIITLALCLNVCPVWVLAADGGGAVALSIGPGESSYIMSSDDSLSYTYEVKNNYLIDTQGHTLSGSQSSVIRVTGTGALNLTGKVVTKSGVGVEVQSGGSLNITGENTYIEGSTYALDIAAGAAVRLSAGEYLGNQAAIRVADGNFAALLADGCAYFDENNRPVLPTDSVNTMPRRVFVRPCTDHEKQSCSHTPGTTTHTWTCPYCATEMLETCMFTIARDGTGTCVCGNTLQITVNEAALADLAYDGAFKPGDGAVTVALTDGSGKALAQDTDYSVEYDIQKDAGEVTVTVTGITFEGTFTNTYPVDRDQTPVLAWSSAVKALDYDGSRVEASDLPSVTINVTNAGNLQNSLQYSYKKQTESTYISGLPTNAGIYDVIVSLPKMGNFEGAVSEPLTLTVNKIVPIATAPAAKPITFNYSAQALVTGGVLKDVAVRDGVKILFATSQNGVYSETIPTDVNAGTYHVWYKVEESENYKAVNPTEIPNVAIQRKTITANISPEKSSFPYDGSNHMPELTVKDGAIEIGKEQYTVTWKNSSNQTVTELKAVGTYTATIQSQTTGNYNFTATATVEITAAEQNALRITNKPDHVYYGGTYRLDVTGGTGNGTLTWSIKSGSATIEPTTGELKITGTGLVTVRAEWAVPNHETVADEWKFTIEPKPVVAEVTVASKPYDGTTDANGNDIKAKVKTSDLVNGDSNVDVYGLTGTYDNANAGTGKTVTLSGDVALTPANTAKYAVSYPPTVQGEITPRPVTVAVTLSGNGLKPDSNGWYYDYDGQDKTPSVTVVGSDAGGYSAALAPSDYEVSYRNNQDVGTNAAVIVTAKAGGNYKFDAKTVNFSIREAGAVLTGSPLARDLTYIKDTAQELVTGGAATGGTVVFSKTGAVGSYSAAIPTETNAGTYTVHYMVKGDANHADTAPSQVSVTIKPKAFTPVITLSQTSYTYNGGAECRPTVTVADGTDVISASEYTVSYHNNINVGTAKVIVSDNNGGNYIVDGEAAFEITKAPAAFTRNPAGKTGLQYTGADQELVTEGVSSHGTVVYSLNGGNYSPVIPKAGARGTYTIDCMIQGDANHSDTTFSPLTVRIDKNTVTNPKIYLFPTELQYNGNPQKPDITVYDANNRLIPEDEYVVTVTGVKSNNMKDVDTYTVTVTPTANSNYDIQGTNTQTYKIVDAGQETISITNTRGQVYYGDVIQLGTTSGVSGSTVKWEIAGNTNTTLTQGGLLTVKDVGNPITVTVTRSAANHSDVSSTWQFIPGKKPVTAVLTGVDKDYDDSTDATIKAKVSETDLVFGDTFTIPDLTGTFDSADVGTNKRITWNGTKPTISDSKAANYEITYPDTATASIFPADICTADVTPPAVKTGLEYTGSPQALVTAGSSAVGMVEYSLDNNDYSASLPTGTAVGSYNVWYRVKGDSNHKDTPGTPLGTAATIVPQNVTSPIVTLTPTSAPYDGKVHHPQVTVLDNNRLEIPDNEYLVTYLSNAGENWTDKGTYTVKIEDISGGSYEIANPVMIPFEITEGAQSLLEITGKPNGKIYYGDTFRLSAAGTITWTSSDSGVAAIDAGGLVTIRTVGTATITATRAAGGNYGEVSAEWTFTAEKKPVTLSVTADDKVYDRNTAATLHVTWPAADLADGDTINPVLTGTFDNAGAGTGKTVRISCATVSDKYDFRYPATVTASISQKSVAPTVTVTGSYTYNGAPITPNVTVQDDADTIPNTEYTLSCSDNTAAGTAAVTVSNADGGNYKIISPVTVNFTIDKATPTLTNPTASGTAGQSLSSISLNGGSATAGGAAVPGSFAWEDDTQTVVAGTSYKVIFTPTDTANYYTAECSVNPTAPSGGAGGGSSSSSDDSSSDSAATIRNPDGSTTQTQTKADGTKVETTVAQNGDRTVVETKRDGSSVTTVAQRDGTTATVNTSASGRTAAEVNLSAAAVNAAQSSGKAVSLPIPQVSAAKSAGAAPTITVNTGSEEDVKVDIPVTNPAPGAVAVLVKDDGTEEVIKTSVPTENGIAAPLADGATVKIVDNSKDFDDVPDTNWASDAVAFASARELFSGTSDTTFSPDQPMSRGTLATVLYSLEGQPEREVTMQDLSGGYSDVDSSAWYADGVAWAVENGIASGYGDGQFGPNDSITREQLAVMLWKYAGSPAASSQSLNFADADQASGYAREALRWAVENGIISGCSNGQLAPGETATRAQAAQMLKNFMENT